MDSIEDNINSKIEIQKENQIPQSFYQTRNKCVCLPVGSEQCSLFVPKKSVLKLMYTVSDFRKPATPAIIEQDHPSRDSSGLGCAHLLPAKVVDYGLIV